MNTNDLPSVFFSLDDGLELKPDPDGETAIQVSLSISGGVMGV